MGMREKRGFSLIEVNMAVYVMATGVLAAAMLYPMGLRESIQSQSDFKQVMFADYVLNIAVAAACSPDVSWTDWKAWAQDHHMAGRGVDGRMTGMNKFGSVPDQTPQFIREALEKAINKYSEFQNKGERTSPHKMDETYAVYCVVVPGFSDQIMGIMVRSLDGDTSKMSRDERKRRLESQPVYYAEARFQGTL